MSDLGYPLCTKNGMLCNEERPSLLMKWFIAFFRCIGKVRGASDSIYKPLMVHIVPLLMRMTLNFHTKSPNLGHYTSKEMGYYTMRRSIHCC